MGDTLCRRSRSPGLEATSSTSQAKPVWSRLRRCATQSFGTPSTWRTHLKSCSSCGSIGSCIRDGRTCERHRCDPCTRSGARRERDERSVTMTGRMMLTLAVLVAMAAASGVRAQTPAPIESELNLITPVSKFIHDAALKAFAEYAKEKWNVAVKVTAIPAGTPIAYGRVVEWKGKPGGDILWGGESALFEKRADQKLAQKGHISRESGESIPASIGKPKPIPLKDRDGYWVGTALEPYGLVYHPKKIRRLGMAEPKEWDDLLDPKLN